MPFAVVAARELGRIAGAAQPFEVDALDDLPVADVEAGDDALGQQKPSTRDQRTQMFAFLVSFVSFVLNQHG